MWYPALLARTLPILINVVSSQVLRHTTKHHTTKPHTTKKHIVTTNGHHDKRTSQQKDITTKRHHDILPSIEKMPHVKRPYVKMFFLSNHNKTQCFLINKGPKAQGQPMLRWWPKANIRWRTQVQCLRTTRRCRHNALLSRTEMGFNQK